jgi:DNA-binding beta-propeller fold protein YncE
VPDSLHDFIAVATYDDGIILHDPLSFAMRSTLAVGGAPGDVAIDLNNGLLGTGTTDGDTATIAHLQPWSVTRIEHVPETDEVAFDSQSHAFYVTDRDVNGAGAVTRIGADGTTSRRVLGLTAEGLVVDSAHRRLYVANVNDATVSIVDADSLVELQRFKAIDRAFALALSPDGSRLYVVSNQSVSSPFAAPGAVIAIDVSARTPHIVARSAALSFPVGIVYDAARRQLFVTDERENRVDVLDPRTLKAVHAPLETCETPWKPAIDRGRLYVPCARADEVDVFDTTTMRRVHGAPFVTGGYPLAVAVWHGR